MTGARVKVAPFFSGGQKKFPDTYYRPENFFALTRAPGMAHNAHDESPLWETGRGGLGKREWYPYRNYRERYRNRKNENYTHCNREISNTRQRQEPESKNENHTPQQANSLTVFDESVHLDAKEEKYMAYLTEKERYQIEILLKEKYTPKQIADILHRHKSTIYREIQRGTVEMLDTNLKTYRKYCADTAQNKYNENKLNKGTGLKIGNDIKLADFIEDKIINEKYSPQAVIFYMESHHLRFSTTLCFKTIYNYIDKGIFLRLDNSHLPMRKARKKHSHRPRICLRNALKRSIEEIPAEARKRAEYGFWEMDTVYSAQGIKECLLVLSERMTRQEIIIPMADRTVVSAINALNSLEQRYGDRFHDTFKAITVDNGVEFSDTKGMESSILHPGENRTMIYYCHPYASYERGTNENINGMIRRFIPKSSDIGRYTEEQIQRIEDWINNYPRKILNGLSSNQYRKVLSIM